MLINMKPHETIDRIQECIDDLDTIEIHIGQTRNLNTTWEMMESWRTKTTSKLVEYVPSHQGVELSNTLHTVSYIPHPLQVLRSSCQMLWKFLPAIRFSVRGNLQLLSFLALQDTIFESIPFQHQGHQVGATV